VNLVYQVIYQVIIDSGKMIVAKKILRKSLVEKFFDQQGGNAPMETRMNYNISSKKLILKEARKDARFIINKLEKHKSFNLGNIPKEGIVFDVHK
jgi:hypothetical protein